VGAGGKGKVEKIRLFLSNSARLPYLEYFPVIDMVATDLKKA